MNKIKVLFISPNPRTMSLVSPTVSLFYSIFRANGIQMEYFDTTFYDISDKYINPDQCRQANLGVKHFSDELEGKKTVKGGRNQLLSDFRDHVSTWKPDVVMASVMESTFLFTLEILRSIRDMGIPHVLGGVFPTFAPELSIRCDEVDIICVGEGEKVIVPLCRRLKTNSSLDGIPNLWVKHKDGSIFKSPMADPVNLDDNPYFNASPFDSRRFYRAMAGKIYRMFPVETHRGCSNKCTFCNSPLQSKKYKKETGKKYLRKRSIANVIKDVIYFSECCHAEYLFFWADNFLLYSRDEIDEFCRAYSEIKLPFYVQTYPATIDEYKIKRLWQVGLHRVGMGVEHGNENFRREIVRRNYSNKSAIDGVDILKQYRVQYSCNNIVGFPTETPELHMDTVRLNRILDPDTASCSIFTPFHGTPLRELALELGYLRDPDVIAPTNDESSILDMPQFTKERIAGKARTFSLYLKFPENRWGHIEQAEKMTPEGERIWQELKEEYSEKYENMDTKPIKIQS